MEFKVVFSIEQCAVPVRKAGSNDSLKELAYEGDQTLIIGRSPDCAVVINDGSISRLHCEVRISDPDVTLSDLGSTNGTFVNDRPIRKQEYYLKDNDEIRLGTGLWMKAHIVSEDYGNPEEISPEDEGKQNADVDDEKFRQIIARLDAMGAGEKIENEQRSSPNDPIEPDPQLIPGYRTVKELKQGLYWRVYLVQNVEDGVEQALKIMNKECVDMLDFKHLFARDSRIGMLLHHPHIVNTFSAGIAQHHKFYVLSEYCPQGSVLDLADVYKANRPDHLAIVPVELATDIILQVLEGLEFAHNVRAEVETKNGKRIKINGLVHKEIKPAHLLVSGTPDLPLIKISDFVISRAAVSYTFFDSIRPMETPFYQPKIQFQKGSEGPSVDVWSTAASYYTLLTGRLPREIKFSANPFAALAQAPTVPIRERNPEIPEALATVIDEALYEDDRQDGLRYETADELREAILKAVR